MKFKATYPNGDCKEVHAELHNGVLCIQTAVPDGYNYRKRRTNPGPWDDDEPEYETVKSRKFRTDYKPMLNRALLERDGKLEQAQKFSKKNDTFASYATWEKYFLRVGANEGVEIEVI